MLIKKNLKAFLTIHAIVFSGVLLIGFSTLAFQSGMISPAVWMTVVGLGLYLGYVPFNCMLFDRLIAAFRYVSNAGFVIYLADAFGYLGSTAILFYKNFGQANRSWLIFFIISAYVIAIAGSLLILISTIYFKLKHQKEMKKAG